jgi:hypothetical protein
MVFTGTVMSWDREEPQYLSHRLFWTKEFTSVTWRTLWIQQWVVCFAGYFRIWAKQRSQDLREYNTVVLWKLKLVRKLSHLPSELKNKSSKSAASFSFLPCFTLLPWRRRQHPPSKCHDFHHTTWPLYSRRRGLLKNRCYNFINCSNNWSNSI